MEEQAANGSETWRNLAFRGENSATRHHGPRSVGKQAPDGCVIACLLAFFVFS